MSMLVRLKPYNVKAGHLLQRYSFRGIRFMGERGWYEVDDEMAAQLKEKRQRLDDETSPLAFDVCTAEEALALEQREKEQAVVKRGAAFPERVAGRGAAAQAPPAAAAAPEPVRQPAPAQAAAAPEPVRQPAAAPAPTPAPTPRPAAPAPAPAAEPRKQPASRRGVGKRK